LSWKLDDKLQPKHCVEQKIEEMLKAVGSIEAQAGERTLRTSDKHWDKERD